MSSRPELSIIIVSWNGRELLSTCLASMARWLSYPHEIIVVDNASTDGTVGMISATFPMVRLIRNSQNAGFATANNQGLALAQANYVAFLNPDTKLINEPFQHLMTELKSDQNIGAIGPQLMNPDLSHQPSVRTFPRWADQVITLLKLRHFLRASRIMRRYLAAHLVNTQTSAEVDELTGAAIVMPTDLIRKLGGWDEKYWIWFDDVDLCQRIHRAGRQVRYDPRSNLIHVGGAIFAQVISVRKQVWYLRSLWRYARRYWNPWLAWSLWPVMAISYGLTLIQSLLKPR